MLVLSAGLENQPGEALPLEYMRVAAARGVDLAEQNPRAILQPWVDFETSEMVICLSEALREQVLELALQSSNRQSVLDLERRVLEYTSFLEGYEDKIQAPKLPELDQFCDTEEELQQIFQQLEACTQALIQRLLIHSA